MEDGQSMTRVRATSYKDSKSGFNCTERRGGIEIETLFQAYNTLEHARCLVVPNAVRWCAPYLASLTLHPNRRAATLRPDRDRVAS
jgi:hypothetical protein